MAERIDFEYLDEHSLTVLENRVSFTPDEINSLIRAIRSPGPVGTDESYERANERYERTVELLRSLSARVDTGGFYQLTKNSARAFLADLESLFDLYLDEND